MKQILFLLLLSFTINLPAYSARTSHTLPESKFVDRFSVQNKSIEDDGEGNGLRTGSIDLGTEPPNKDDAYGNAPVTDAISFFLVLGCIYGIYVFKRKKTVNYVFDVL